MDPANGWQWPLTGHEVVSEARASLLGVAGTTASLEATFAEATRSALWAYCRLSRQTYVSESAVTTREVLTLARGLISPLRLDALASLDIESRRNREANDTPETDMSVSRGILDLLAEQGDVKALAGGRWIPSPARIVPIDGIPLSVLAGCQPAREYPLEAQHAMQFFGTFRRIEGTPFAAEADTLAASLHLPIQPLALWLGPIPPTRDELLGWLDTADLSPIAHAQSAAVSLSEVEAYAPYVDKPQGLRWMPLRHLSHDGRYLLRQRTSWGGARYTFGEARQGTLIAQSGAALPSEHIRRLCYALDRQARTPTKAELDRKRGVLVLHSEVPARERKLLSTLGLLEVQGAAYYPRRWTHLPAASAERIERMLADLGTEAITR